MNDIAERVTELTPASHRAALLEQLLDHLDHANSIQQELLGDTEPQQCYEFHNELENLADRISDTVRET